MQRTDDFTRAKLETLSISKSRCIVSLSTSSTHKLMIAGDITSAKVAKKLLKARFLAASKAIVEAPAIGSAVAEEGWDDDAEMQRLADIAEHLQYQS